MLKILVIITQKYTCFFSECQILTAKPVSIMLKELGLYQYVYNCDICGNER